MSYITIYVILWFFLVGHWEIKKDATNDIFAILNQNSS